MATQTEPRADVSRRRVIAYWVTTAVSVPRRSTPTQAGNS
jgi:hypothetical protein